MSTSNKTTEQLLNLKLVKEIEKYPCLYNNTLTEYSRKDITEKVWRKIGEKVNLTGNECKERWKNLRTVFVRHIKPAPNGSPSKLKKPYYLADAMQFTLPFIKFFQHSTLNLPVPPEEMKKELRDENESNILNTNNYEMLVTISSPRSMSLQSTSPRPSLPTSSPPPSPHPLLSPQPMTSKELYYCQTASKRSQDDADKSCPDFSITKKSKVEEYNDQKEANKMFLLSLLPDMNDMSPSQKRKFKKNVIDMLNDILENTTD